MDVRERLAQLGLSLPALARPVASYLPAVRVGELIFVSGQLPKRGQEMIQGAVPGQVSVEQAQEGARRCVLNALAVLDAELGGDWSKLVRIVQIGVFVNSELGFAKQHEVANGASDLLEQILGEAGKHSRFAVGSYGLPLGAAVELELTAQVRA